jgi:LytS/YehU family sensor histidine kinase
MGLWLAIYFGVHAAWNYRQAEVDKWKLEAQAETARLKALKLQLNPHFFFNSLNSLRALIAEDPDRAQRMVTRLARLLRTTLQVDDVKTVPLEEELSTVQTYLELEMVRFEERLQYEIDASEAARERPVPFLLGQTLVENAIKHGVAKQRDGGTITIKADVVADALRLRITNPGTLEAETGGVGLANARERLQLLFGDEASLRVENATADTVEATAILPHRAEEERPVLAANPATAEA